MQYRMQNRGVLWACWSVVARW